MLKKLSILLPLLSIVFITGCNTKKNKAEESKSESMEVSGQTNSKIPQSWVDKRVAKAEKRLLGSDAGKVIWASMEAHGGLDNWFGNGSLAFRFNYIPLDGKTPRDSYQTVDVWSNRAKHTSVTDSTARFGYTGEKAWLQIKDSTAFAYDTKFWALTPIYLMGHPFVLDGEGVNLELLPQTEYQGKANDVVKATFDAGTGDAPDDYYILQFDAESHLLTATRYIVSYPEYFKDGGHNPEKFMEVGELIDVDGVLLPKSLKTHWTVDGQPGEHITNIEVSEMHFIKDLPEDYYDMPENAEEL
ncbi:hypothetical protein B0O79_0869 [Flavobacteriaceae bacterium MAR_2009_75]|nr:hypothetical protein B0O79_0869 [Flavobacteriaceae bacterium MAR_2009_75]